MPTTELDEEFSSVAATLFFYYVFYMGVFCYIRGFDILDEANFQVYPPILTRLLKSLLGITLYYSWDNSVLFVVLRSNHSFTGRQNPGLLCLGRMADIEILLTSFIGKVSLACYFLTLWNFFVFRFVVEGVISHFLMLATLFLYKTSLKEPLSNLSLSFFLCRRRKIIQFGLGMLSSILFQNFVSLTTMEHVSAFLCFSGVWLCSLAMLHPFSDPGVLVFLLSNVSLGCTMNIHGMRPETWIVYGVCLFLYWLRSLVHTLLLAFTRIMVRIVVF